MSIVISQKYKQVIASTQDRGIITPLHVYRLPSIYRHVLVVYDWKASLFVSTNTS